MNALGFHVAWRRGRALDEPRAPSAARAAAVVSMLLWASVIVLGRALGYERREPPPSDVESLLELAIGAERSDPSR